MALERIVIPHSPEFLFDQDVNWNVSSPMNRSSPLPKSESV